MEIKQLQYLVESAKRKSFSQAAKSLYTTQPNISKHMLKLEEELGVSIFQRNNTGIHLTPQGQQVYEFASQVLMMLDDLKIELKKE